MRALAFYLFKILKRLLRVPGVSTLNKFLGRIKMYDKLKPKGIVLIEVQGNKMYVNTDETGIVPLLLIDGMIEKYQTQLFKEMVKEGMVVVDIGANIGYYTLIAARLVGKDGVVYAFEPIPSNYELLCRNIEVNQYTNVVPIQKAVSDKQREREELWTDKTDLAIPSFSKDNVLAFSKDETLTRDSFVEVETITLDKFFESTAENNRVDIIKIDTQGAEGLVVDGAEKILRSNNVKILMEFWAYGLHNLGTDPLKLLQKVQEYGFKIQLINERKQALEPVETVEFCKTAKPTEEFSLLLEK